ncbi:vesicle-associated protein 2-2-like isoform X1 [Chenopodium quinoa]|uniref:vesicle-associated protein 2-2-like isoform X1 n=1 Tax=Chenopodium quinoa TaxID=63459 RepID=UPI000B772577|nr:vesicle-associated protein 2-2-like isoform X1 [Chenopodium quinoa]
MGSQLEIQPRELKFIVVELNKQIKCTVSLSNKTDQYVAFKVKTTSPKKYCVRPNVGVIQPKSVNEFIVIMQALKTAPADMTCKDKFLVQSTIVPEGTMEEDITSEMFVKDGVKYIEEMKMRVNLVIPTPPSPELLPLNGTVKQVDDHVESKTVNKEDLKPVKDTVHSDVARSQDVKSEPIKQMNYDLNKVVDSSVKKDVEPQLTKDSKEIKPVTRNNEESQIIEPRIPVIEEDQRLFKDVEEMKSKLHELESKLSKAEVTISNLTEERRLVIQERENLKQEMSFLKSRKVERRVQDGFPLMFVCMVALISLIAGYGFHL